MTVEAVERVLAESRRSRDDGDADLAPLRWAILIEDAFGVTLTDREIAGLRDEASARSLLLGRLTQA